VRISGLDRFFPEIPNWEGKSWKKTWKIMETHGKTLLKLEDFQEISQKSIESSTSHSF